MADVDSTMETVEPDREPSLPSMPVAFAPPAAPPRTEEKKTDFVVKKQKKRPRDEIDDIFGF